MHDLMIHLRNEPQARHSVVHCVLDIYNLHSSVQLLILATKCESVATSICYVSNILCPCHMEVMYA
jgi:hypothetical protein